jgi:ABC-type multidrug transport system fused ATPase/permease subunit
MLFFFIANELSLTFFLRILSNYELVRDGADNFMGANLGVFWGVLAIITFLYFITLVLKHYFLHRVVLNANTSLH